MVANSLQRKCVSSEVKLMVGNMEDLYEIWSMLNICSELSKKYISRH